MTSIKCQDMTVITTKKIFCTLFLEIYYVHDLRLYKNNSHWKIVEKMCEDQLLESIIALLLDNMTSNVCQTCLLTDLTIKIAM